MVFNFLSLLNRFFLIRGLHCCGRKSQISHHPQSRVFHLVQAEPQWRLGRELFGLREQELSRRRNWLGWFVILISLLFFNSR